MERDGKMEKSIISEGKTTNEAIEKGLKILNVSKNKVDIKGFFAFINSPSLKMPNIILPIQGRHFHR